METTIKNAELKQLLKAILVEVLEERPDLLTRIVEDTLENIALVTAIHSAKDSPLVKREEIMQFFKGNV